MLVRARCWNENILLKDGVAQQASYCSYRYGIHAGAGIWHCTHTCVTCGLKTAGKPIPVWNPK